MTKEVVALTDGTTTSKKKMWGDRYSMVVALRRNAGKYVEGLRAKPGKGKAVVCIDERVQPVSGEFYAMDLYRLAGSGILLGENLQDSLDKAETLLADKVNLITWHRGCGAAAAAMKKHGVSGDVDNYARDFAKELSERLGLPCREIPLHGPVSFHSARGVIYDGTGRYKATGAMPEMFVVSRFLIEDKSIALAEIQTAVDIAMGHHGFGEMFREQPFVILVLAMSQGQLDELLEEIDSQKLHLDMERVEVHGAVV